MDEESVRSALSSAAFLYPPMEPFEPPAQNANETMRSVIQKCEILCNIDAVRDKLYVWLSILTGRADAAFYGGMVHGMHQIRDADVLSFGSKSLPLSHSSPIFVHIYSMNPEDGADATGLFLANTLLFPCTPGGETVARIEAARKQLSSNPFFDGGIGELVTYAAFKFACITGSKPLTVRWKWVNESSMETKTHTPHEVNNQIRNQMQEMDDKGVHELTMAAMRRIRIK
ncbi:MAG: hypothetical protein PHF60_05325, partial [Candidatus ainarchaeum sp.]|nr:hypothetical protein [Candidatus ainarchaeum sp.]